MRISTRAVAVAVVAAAALVYSTAAPGVPVEWKAHAPWTSGDPAGETAAAAGTSPAALNRAAASKPPQGSLPAQQAISELRRSGAVALSSRGAVASVAGTKVGSDGPDAFVHRYAAAFGLTDANGLARVSSEQVGADTVTRYAQTAAGLPVLGGEIVVTSHGSAVKAALATASLAAPSGTATVTAAKAGPIALTAAAQKLSLTGLHVAATKQWQYDPSVIGAPGPAGLRPTWQVDLSDRFGAAATVLVDAVDGTVRATSSSQESAKNRLVCDQNSAETDLSVRSNYACPGGSAVVGKTQRAEGGAVAGVSEVDKAYDLLGMVYDFYRSNLALDSYDDRGAQIKATVRACDLPYPNYQNCHPFPNAFWEGTQFVFGEGYAIDDVVAHEFTHAVTEHSSHLLYLYQPGAINESISDIMGELFDQSFTAAGETEQPWLLGEDLPGGAIRDMANPNHFWQPSCVGCLYWYTGDLDNGGVHTNSGVGNYLAYEIASAIGNAKSLQLWWRAMHVMPSGSTYPLLGTALQNACLQLIGFHGFTRADCISIRGFAQSVTTAQGWSQSWNGCPGLEPAEVLYREGFERGTAWTMSSAHWEPIPAADAQYQFANSGNGSLDGWVSVDSTGKVFGNGATATSPVFMMPSTGPVMISFARAALTVGSTSVHAYLEMNVNGAGWKAATFSRTSAGTYPVAVSGPDYADLWADVSTLAGKRVQFRFRISANAVFDFYVDDFRLYTCVNRPAAPMAAAYLNDGTATVTILTEYAPSPVMPPAIEWGYLPSGQTIDHYEYRFIPAIPGAPITSSGPTITVPDVPPGTYTVTFRAVTNTGLASAWSSTRLSDSPPPDCQSVVYPTGSTLGQRPDPCSLHRAGLKQ